MKLDLYEQSGAKKGTVDVSDSMFQVPVHEELIRLAVLRQQANARQSNACTKTRGEVRGGGKKPWRQKGTGRARFGSSRNPIWRGGGIVFGPIGEANYSKNLPKKARRLALFSSLSQKATEGSVFVLDSFEVKTPKTKVFMDMVGKLPVERSLLVVLSEKDSNLEKSANNLPNVKTILVNYLNIFDLLKYEKIMFLEPALKKAEELFLN
ncbi:50S ribosomal protein L4 [Candidatus Peregrinibacteria bacterium CG_4_10_14_0_2_um_filter_43_11]|nr:MAG: 50S ribosomal protein L4 [Candidatus Peregrinibacteria bacterium CG_4_10_14_0_2_um_filter_43_11]